jgi:hypothetical protein
MSTTSQPLSGPASRPLPWFKGPKLGPFTFRDELKPDIRFLEHLGGGAHAEVFRAVIDGSDYAIKLVYFPPEGKVPAECC